MILRLPQPRPTLRSNLKPLHKVSAMHRQAHWKISDLPWAYFERDRVDPELLKAVKAAALVEYGGLKYSRYLCKIFSGDSDLVHVAQRWGLEEVQHGDALGRYAALADPLFDFNRAYSRNIAGGSINTEPDTETKKHIAIELVMRCMVEIGRGSFYTALATVTNEPLLKTICRTIATDEYRHYGMFFAHLKRYMEIEKPSRAACAKIVLSRLIGAEDDEMAYAYYAANTSESTAYDRKKYIRCYQGRVLPLYSQEIVRHNTALVFKACGFRSYSAAEALASRLAWKFLQRKIRDKDVSLA